VLDDSPTIYWWDGQTWHSYSHEKLFSASALAVDAVGTLWIAWGYQSAGVFTYCAGYGRLFENLPAEFCQLSPHPPVIDLLAVESGMWVLGEGWFSGPNDQVYPSPIFRPAIGLRRSLPVKRV
jgi:hypothetical protein